MATGRLLLQIIFGLLYVIILGGGWRWFWIGLWVQGWSWWVWWWPIVLCCRLWLVWSCLRWSKWSNCCGGRIFGWVCCDLVVATVVCFFFFFGSSTHGGVMCCILWLDYSDLGYLICVFKQLFSVFKQYFTCFHILFHPHIFS